MTVSIYARNNIIRIIDLHEELPPATKSALRLYGFSRRGDELLAQLDEYQELLLSVLDLLHETGTRIELAGDAKDIIRLSQEAKAELEDSRRSGADVKSGNLNQPANADFREFLISGLQRPLLRHQVKAALHLVNVAHGANFSVPGAGKTSVVLAVYEYLRLGGSINVLFVVGPRSSFTPWESEFELTLGRRPSVQILAGGDVRDRHSKYYARSTSPAELYLTTYHTLSRDRKQVQHLLQERNTAALFVIDEAHYMKQDEGVWASAVADTSKLARKRCVLTGTPFPKHYADGINQFDVLYPNSGIFESRVRQEIRRASEAGEHHVARALIEPRISSLFYRVRKSELGLTLPVFHPATRIVMNRIERELYECIQKRIGELAQSLNDFDLATSISLQRGRQIRRRQAISYSALLLSGIDGYSEELIDPKNEYLANKVQHYDEIETPAKLETLSDILQEFSREGKKVVVWANFVGTLRRIRQECDRLNLESKIVYGGTPLEDGREEDSRDTIIESFKDAASGMNILIANPAACAESVSLHKTCSNAIYYDLSYNCAEYLQSIDRIHRVGGSEQKLSYYHFLQYADTFEDQIISNLTDKTLRMSAVIDQDFPLALSELPELGQDLDGIVA